MLGDSAVLGGGGGGGEGGGSGDSVAASAAATHDAATAGGGGGGGIGSNSGSDIERGRIEEGERSFGGNRWPRQETLALLSIRCDMDVAFRDASVKGPLWEEVSRKLAELGYHRSAKKCKEKFENVYKYHKRTKDGRSGKSDGKTYRFFDQLEALDQIHHPSSHQPPTPSNTPQLSLPAPPPPSLVATTTAAMSLPISTATITTVPLPIPMPMPPVTNTTLSVPNVTVPSTTSLPNTPIPQPQSIVITTPPMNLTTPSYPQPTNFQPSTANPPPVSFPHNIPTDLLSNSSSYSTSSDETLEGTRKRKRKWKDFFERLMQEVIEKQEELQKRFLEAIEKREHERMVREEAWRAQEMQRINREREILAQERSIAAAKDAAVMSFLQKIADQQNLGQQALSNINVVQPQPAPPQQQPQVPNAAAAPPAAQVHAPPPPQQQLPPVVQPGPPQQPVMVPQQQQQQQQQVVTNMEIVKVDNNGENLTPASSSRWPKVEVEALIKLRTSLDAKYQENGPKGPLWEEISAGMKRLGYNRNAKRCKEKWENINKYFKKVKESNKRRPEDSKTCPYFHQLDALYREKNNAGGSNSKAESMVAPLMVRPEQQWPPQQMDDPMEQNRGEEGDDMDEDDKDGEEDEEEDEGGGSGSGGSNFEIVAASKPSE